jgi:tetratricopeptide (TPR) repeat protein
VETPHLDRFRRDAVLYQRAYAPTPMTLPSHVTMLTGLQPNRHGVRNNIGFQYDPAAFPPVSETLRQKGYATGAAVSTYVLRGESGMGKAFESYEDSIEPPPGGAFAEYQRSGRVTSRLAQEWIAGNAARPFFYFLHIYEPHVPYDPPEPFKSRYPNAYDGEIANADAIIGEFLESLRRSGIYDRALIIVTSDHGEGLGDHGEEQHSVLLYREALQIPLLIKFPGNDRSGTAVQEPVQLADLAPTILAAAGHTEARAVDGISLLAESVPPDRPIYGESLFPLIHFGWSDLRSLIRGQYHFIESPSPELYDLLADPAERVNIIDRTRRVATAMRRDLQAFDVGEITPSAVDPETARKLAALGYLGSPRAGGGGDRRNPVEHIGILNDIRSAFETASAGRATEAIAMMRSLLARDPDLVEVRIRLAEILAAEGKNEEAFAEYQETLRRSPIPLPDTAVQAGSLLLRMRRYEESEKLARQAADATPDKANELLARIALARNDLAAADAAARAAHRASGSPAHLVLQAEVAQRKGDFPGALALLDQAAVAAAAVQTPKVYRLHYVRADTFAKTDRPAEAIAEYRREIELFPSNLDAYAALAVIHYIQGERTEVDRLMAQMVKANPTARAREMAARTYQAFGEERAVARYR